MVVEKPGKKFYVSSESWADRLDSEYFPKAANIEVSECFPAPNGWFLGIVWIGYTQNEEMYILLRYSAGDSVAEVGPGWAGEVVDMEWFEQEGWSVETAWDDGESDLGDLDWTIQYEGESFDTALSTSFDFMKHNGEYEPR